MVIPKRYLHFVDKVQLLPPQAINWLMHLNYYFCLIVIGFVRIKARHNSRL